MNKAVRPHLIAHRGWSKAFPENSLAALAAGITAGADIIEFDVRLTKDEVPVLCHDKSVDRVSNLTGPVNGFVKEELAQADMVMPHGSLARGLGFTFLDSVLRLFSGAVGMNIHVKETDHPRLVLEVLGRSLRGVPTQNVYIAAGPDVLEMATEVCPELPRCCLDSTNDPAAMLRNAQDLGCERVQFRRITVTKELVDQALRAGVVPNLYYADEFAEAENALDMGILGLLTNDIGPVRLHLLGGGYISR